MSQSPRSVRALAARSPRLGSALGGKGGGEGGGGEGGGGEGAGEGGFSWRVGRERGVATAAAVGAASLETAHSSLPTGTRRADDAHNMLWYGDEVL